MSIVIDSISKTEAIEILNLISLATYNLNAIKLEEIRYQYTVDEESINYEYPT